MVDLAVLRVTYVEQLPPPHRNGAVKIDERVQRHQTFVSHQRRPRRTSSTSWRDRIALALLLGAAFLALVFLIVGFVVAVNAIGGLVHIVRGEL